MKKVLKKALGVILIILGFLALITPFSPGSWLILVGLEILGLRLLLERKLSSLLKEKHRRKLTDLKQKAKRFLRIGSG
jgi:hypothetical protein